MVHSPVPRVPSPSPRTQGQLTSSSDPEACWQLLQRHERLLIRIMIEQRIDWIPGIGGTESKESESAQAEAFKRRVRYAGDAAYSEDMRQVGLLGMLESLQRFDPERGFTFGTFARKHVRGAIQSAKREEAEYREFLRGPSETEPSPDNPRAYQMWPSAQDLRKPSIDADPEPNNPHQEEMQAAVQQFVESLPARQRRAVELVYYEGMRPAEAARVLGVSREAVRKALGKVHDCGRTALGAYAPQ